MYAIEIENLSKQYTLGKIGTSTLARDLNIWWARMRGKENPYLKIGQTNDRTQKADGDFVWALRDINFRVEEGDVVGIIGKNGAGKSTLLKILSRVTTPTTGRITSYGRIASLLEVGTGFHGEMTGRENIYMNGSIMGMTRAEITRKLDEIVDFAGVEKYIDTPVKRYSSGMTVRLGFAVAAFLEPEILIVDEVLAVGDAEFQKKAIGKMQDVSKGQGRTVLFVSHNMNAVKKLCRSVVVLNNGTIATMGNVDDCVDYYLESSNNIVFSHSIITDANREYLGLYKREIALNEIWLNNPTPEAIATDEPLDFTISLICSTEIDEKYQIAIIFLNNENQRVAFYLSDMLSAPKQGEFKLHVVIPKHALTKGVYSVRLETVRLDFSTGNHPMDYANNTVRFEIKYLHQTKLDEYLHWQKWWALRLHESKEFIVETIQ